MLRRSLVVAPGALGAFVALSRLAPVPFVLGAAASVGATSARAQRRSDPSVAATDASAGSTAPRRPTPLRFGADRSLGASGLARSLQRAFAVDTGIDVKLVVLPASALLEAIRDGEVDVALANAPAAEIALERQTLVHDRRAIAISDFVLVGPRPPMQPPAWPPTRAAPGRTEAGPRRDALATLAAIQDRGEGGPGGPGVVFLGCGDGSGAHLCEQALWRAAGIEPRPPWYRSWQPAAGDRTSFLGEARRLGAYALAERGEWLAEGGAPLGIVAEGGPALAAPVHAMRSFRVRHPAGKIFLAWVGGRQGRAVAARQRGYRAVAA